MVLYPRYARSAEQHSEETEGSPREIERLRARRVVSVAG